MIASLHGLLCLLNNLLLLAECSVEVTSPLAWAAANASPLAWAAANGGVTNGGLRGVWPPFLEIGRNRPFSPFFCLFHPFLEGAKSTWEIQKTEEKGLFPQISSDLLKPPSLKPPFAALQLANPLSVLLFILLNERRHSTVVPSELEHTIPQKHYIHKNILGESIFGSLHSFHVIHRASRTLRTLSY